MMMLFTINVQERRSERARVHSQNILFGEKHKLMMVKLFFRKETRGGGIYITKEYVDIVEIVFIF